MLLRRVTTQSDKRSSNKEAIHNFYALIYPGSKVPVKYKQNQWQRSLKIN